MAEPTVKERKAFAASGVAMPDGSFYIRNADDLQNAIDSVGRATPNADESETARRDAVRKHIITRAVALKLSSRIPDTWNSDGSLKHSQVEEFIMHFGRKGMHWGEHVFGRDEGTGYDGKKAGGTTTTPSAKRQKLEARAQKHEDIAVAHGKVVADLERQHRDLMRRGVRSEPFQKVYGLHADRQSDLQFYLKNGVNKAQALGQNENDLRMLRNSYVRSVNHHSAKAAKLRERALKHTDLELEAEEFLEHFGRKGMRWGEHVFGTDRGGRAPGGPSHHDAQDANALKDRVRQHGTGSLSNAELQRLTTRLNLEKQYNNLSPQDISLGRHIVGELLSEGGQIGKNVARQSITEFAKKYAVKGLEEIVKSAVK